MRAMGILGFSIFFSFSSFSFAVIVFPYAVGGFFPTTEEVLFTGYGLLSLAPPLMLDYLFIILN
jgi:hypothetical protein